MPAEIVYADTNKPNSAKLMLKSAVSCGPKGIMIMKSTMWVNWMPAKDRSNSNSLRGVSDVFINNFFVLWRTISNF